MSSFFRGCLVNYNNYSIDILKYITIIGVIYVEKIALPIDSHTNVFFSAKYLVYDKKKYKQYINHYAKDKCN